MIFDWFSEAGGAPDAGIIAGEEVMMVELFSGHALAFGVIAVPDGSVLQENRGGEGAAALGMGEGGESASPGDVAMAGRVERVLGFAEDPFGAVVGFAESEVVGGDVGFGPGEAFFGHGELVHEGETEVVFFGGEVHFCESAGEVFGGFPADLTAEAGLVTGGLEVFEVFEEVEQDGFEEVPIFGAASAEGAEPEFIAARFVDVDAGEVALAGSGDVEAEAIFDF